MRRPLVRAITACLIALVFAPANAEGRGTFERGVEAARAGEYEQAVAWFRAARDAGVETPALFFNLGVALYRLERLPEAVEAFELAAQSRAMGGPAAYNLGRIARERGDEAHARYWFEQAAQRAQTAAVRERARDQLAPNPDSESSPSISGALALGIGHDGNIALTPADSRVSRESDEFALTEAYLQADWDTPAYLFASAYAERYTSASDYDLTALQLGAGWEGADGPWPTHRLTVRQIRFAGDPFEEAALWDAQSTFETDKGVARLGFGAAMLNGANEYDYLDGHRWHIDSTWAQTAFGGWWNSTFRLTTVDREDLREDGRFYSYSYRLQRLTTRYHHSLTPQLDLTLGARWAHYRYADPNVRADQTTERRTEDELELSLRFARNLAQRWRVSARVAAQERRANLERYGYERTTFSVRLTRDF